MLSGVWDNNKIGSRMTTALDYPVAVNTATGSNASLDYEFNTGLNIQAEISIADALRSEHPDYSAKVEEWQKYIDVYTANDIYRFIHKHLREHDDSWSARIKRGYFYNYSASLVDLFVAYLFEGGIVRHPDPSVSDVLNDIYTDATRSGTVSYELLMKIAATFATAMGHVGILVDMPSNGGEMSEEERKDRKHRPYLTLIKSTQIIDWECDESGAFEWVKIEVAAPRNRSWKTAYDSTKKAYVIWSKHHWEKWIVTDDDAVLVGTDVHDLGEVPLVILKSDISIVHEWFGESAIRDIADINLAILNWCSFADEEIANRCLNVLTAQENGDDAPVNISHHNVLTYPEGCDRPEYLSPSETVLKLIREQINDARDEIYRLARLSGSTGLLGSREATSGIAYAFEFNETNQSLSAKARFLEQAETSIHRIIGKWLGHKETNTTISYPDEFGVVDFLSDLELLTQAKTTLSSETAKKTLEQRVCSKMFSRETQTIRDKIRKEVEKAVVPKPSMFATNSFGSVPKQMIAGDENEKPKEADKSKDDTTKDKSE